MARFGPYGPHFIIITHFHNKLTQVYKIHSNTKNFNEKYSISNLQYLVQEIFYLTTAVFITTVKGFIHLIEQGFQTILKNISLIIGFISNVQVIYKFQFNKLLIVMITTVIVVKRFITLYLQG